MESLKKFESSRGRSRLLRSIQEELFETARQVTVYSLFNLLTGKCRESLGGFSHTHAKRPAVFFIPSSDGIEPNGTDDDRQASIRRVRGYDSDNSARSLSIDYMIDPVDGEASETESDRHGAEGLQDGNETEDKDSDEQDNSSSEEDGEDEGSSEEDGEDEGAAWTRRVATRRMVAARRVEGDDGGSEVY